MLSVFVVNQSAWAKAHFDQLSPFDDGTSVSGAFRLRIICYKIWSEDDNMQAENQEL